jgi:Putative transmembrane protein (PGPGW)
MKISTLISYGMFLLVGSIFSIVVAIAVILLLPTDFLVRQPQPRAVSIRLIITQLLLNILGLVIFSVGVIMLFTPGQGLITIAVGLVMLPIPGKQRLLRSILTPKRLKSLNKLRVKFQRAPFVY